MAISLYHQCDLGEPNFIAFIGGIPMIEVEVAFISIAASTGTPIVFLKEKTGEPKQLLPIWIGPPEATAIQAHLKGDTPPRPMTHDLLKTIVESLGATVVSVCVHSMENQTFFGQITLDAKGKSIEIDSRPSDAIAVAIRFGATIYVAEKVLRENGISETELKAAQQQQTKSTLENLDEDSLREYTV
jgi:uncharacterized protein